MYIYIYIFISKVSRKTRSCNLQPNFIQCSNVKNYGVKISLFLCDVRLLDLQRKSS